MYGGTVISSSLAERAVVEITPADGVELVICGERQQLSGAESLKLSGGFTDVAKAVFTRFPEVLSGPGFQLRGETTIPIQAGLAGSTSMLAAILGAVLKLLGRDEHRYQVAETVREIEFHIMDCICGYQDQHMVVFGGLNCMDFRGKDAAASGELPLAMVEPLEPGGDGLPLLLANTGVQRHSGSVHRAPRERWLEGDPAVVRGYARIAELARFGKRDIIEGNWRQVAEGMNENHAIARELGGSGEANEALISQALASGAWGAKLAGAGKGGTIVAVHEDPEYLAGRMLAAGAARVLRVVPSPGLTVEGAL
jgi:galactokinase/mevalonate kinase-like predicted kinase